MKNQDATTLTRGELRSMLLLFFYKEGDMDTDRAVEVYRWPGGAKTIAGGTRTEIKLSRPWQKDIELNPAACQFCHHLTHDQILNEVPAYGLKVIRNIFTPFSYHRMVIPNECWGKERLRALGGATAIADALITAFQFVLAPAVQSNSCSTMIMCVHVGALAGQNIPHLHWHILAPEEPVVSYHAQSELWRKTFHLAPRFVLWNDTMFCGVGGVRAGQCIIIKDKTTPSLLDVAEAVHRAVLLGNRAWKSTEGLPPDYSVSLLWSGLELEFILYTPILNHWGGNDIISSFAGNAVTLPWPHETTAEYLRKT